jgi:hypothetical protein
MQKSLRSVCAEKIVLTDELKVKTKGWKETKYKLDRAEGTHKQQIAITMAAQKNQLEELTSMIDSLTTTVDELEEANSGGEKKDTGVAQLIDTVSEAGLHLAVAVTVATLCAITSSRGPQCARVWCPRCDKSSTHWVLPRHVEDTVKHTLTAHQ